jgi:hypothetical protein
MNITDLETCELVEFDNQIVGGAKAYTNTNTYASEGLAYGEAGGVAVGDYTITQAKVSTNTYKDDYSSLSYSFANADAKAKDKNSYSLSTSHSSSIWISKS